MRRETGLATVAFADLLFLMLFGFVVILAILWPYINDPAEDSAEQPPGLITVQVEWPDALDVDIDLWVLAPGNDRPIGYSNLGGKTANLLRDDLGFNRDPSNNNAEFFASRNAGAGEWIVNLHYFAQHHGGGPVPAHVWVTRLPSSGSGSGIVIAERTVTLAYAGTELTVFRFRLDADGQLIEDSMNDRFMALRAGRNWSGR